MSPKEFRKTHGDVEDWSAEDYERYLDICDGVTCQQRETTCACGTETTGVTA